MNVTGTEEEWMEEEWPEDELEAATMLSAEEQNPLTLSKSLLAVIIFVVAAAGAFIAWRVRRTGGRCIAYAEAFAGGALLNAALVHLLADAAEDLVAGYPLAQLLCGLGCILTHLAEGVTEASFFKMAEPPLKKEGQEVPLPRPVSLGRAADDEEAAYKSEASPNKVVRRGSEAEHETKTFVSQEEKAAGQTAADLAELAVTWRSLAAGPLLMVALSVHSLLEGLSLGAATTARAVHIFVAILAHKGVAAFSLGTAWLHACNHGGRYATAMTWFASVTPIGILMGTPVEGGPSGAYITALSAGTFLYVGLIEACPGIRTPWLPGAGAVNQAMSFCMGFASMGALALWT